MANSLIGRKVKLLRPVVGRYSGYAGRPNFAAPIGTVLTIHSGPHPYVTGPGGQFWNAHQGEEWGSALYSKNIEREAAAGRWLEGFGLDRKDFALVREVAS